MDKIEHIVSHSRPAQTFGSKFYLVLGIFLVALALYYFVIEFSPSRMDRIEEWGVLGVGGLMGIFFILAFSLDWNLPHAKKYWLEYTYVFNPEKKALQVYFESSIKPKELQKSYSLEGVEKLVLQSETVHSQGERQKTVYDPTNPIAQTSPTNQYVKTEKYNHTIRVHHLQLAPTDTQLRVSRHASPHYFEKEMNESFNAYQKAI